MNHSSGLLSRGVIERRAPFLVGMVGTSKGTCLSGSAGEVSAGTLSDTTIFRVISMSKAVGATAAAILADRGILDWDTPVEDILPNFGKLTVLVSFDKKNAQLRQPATRATLRHLATHTSGLFYGFWDEQIAQYLEANGIPPVVSRLCASLACPLAFDPGDRWQYGSGVDWLGLVVEALDGRSIRQFCHEEIFDPLRMSDTRFELDKVLAARLVPAFARSAEGGFVEPQINVDPPAHPEFYGIGHALYSTAADYMRFLRMWLGKGELDGVQILKPDSATQYLENHIGELRVLPLRTALLAAV
jgi:methyl acetate hydrolase